MARCLYFGCIGETGHYLFCEPARGAYHVDKHSSAFPMNFPMRPETLDCGLIPPRTSALKKQGDAVFNHINGWSVISFWDQSVDKRPGSNSNFIVEGLHNFEDALFIARETFPEVFARFAFEITHIVLD